LLPPFAPHFELAFAAQDLPCFDPHFDISDAVHLPLHFGPQPACAATPDSARTEAAAIVDNIERFFIEVSLVDTPTGWGGSRREVARLVFLLVTSSFKAVRKFDDNKNVHCTCFLLNCNTNTH
jgi:hypothetical protein